MKRNLLIIVAAAVALSFALGGCLGNTWRVSFAVPGNYSDWGEQDYGGEIESVLGIGARLDRWALNSPIAFDEDFTVTVNLGLNVDADNTASFGICVGDSSGFFPPNYIYSRFFDIGDEEYEDWWVEDSGATMTEVGKVLDGTVPTLLRRGPNVWKLVKTGSNIKVYVNLYKVADFAMTKCAASKHYINLYADLTGGGDVIFSSVKVDYKGSIAP